MEVQHTFGIILVASAVILGIVYLIITNEKAEKTAKESQTKFSGIMSEAAYYEQLAEEASELAHAALKYARILRQENPTPVPSEEAHDHVIEEYSDVVLCTRLLSISTDESQIEFKTGRMLNRFEEASLRS